MRYHNHVAFRRGEWLTPYFAIKCGYFAVMFAMAGNLMFAILRGVMRVGLLKWGV